MAVGDRIALRVLRESTYTETTTVDAQGQVVLPQLGLLTVAGLPIAAVQDTVRARYSEFFRNPAVSVTVLRRVGVEGEVKSPGLYYVDPTMTLRDLIAQSGGLTEAANADHVEVVRDGRRLGLTGSEAISAITVLRSGDAVVVGRRSWFSRNSLAVVSTLGLVVSVAVQAIRR